LPLPGQAGVTAMMPPVPWRPYPIDLLTCGLVSPLLSGEIALLAASATVYGNSGVEVSVGPAWFQGNDEGPVVRGWRTLWPGLHSLDSDYR
jgi:hypothetical protein